MALAGADENGAWPVCMILVCSYISFFAGLIMHQKIQEFKLQTKLVVLQPPAITAVLEEPARSGDTLF